MTDISHIGSVDFLCTQSAPMYAFFLAQATPIAADDGWQREPDGGMSAEHHKGSLSLLRRMLHMEQ